MAHLIVSKCLPLNKYYKKCFIKAIKSQINEN